MYIRVKIVYTYITLEYGVCVCACVCVCVKLSSTGFAPALLRWLSTLDGSVGSGKHRTKLSAASPTGEECKHPLFGLKSCLVRLVANLCYKCPAAQTKVGTHTTASHNFEI